VHSWLDLGATWNYATQNGSGSELDVSVITFSRSEKQLIVTQKLFENPGYTSFDFTAPDYSLLEGDNPNLIF
jgi:hypothetical protein